MRLGSAGRGLLELLAGHIGVGFVPALIAQQLTEFLHGASAAVSEKAGAGFVPLVVMNPTNAVRVAAVLLASVS